MTCFFLFFFFQAEDGIRDGHVTGVQTCALPISRSPVAFRKNRTSSTVITASAARTQATRARGSSGTSQPNVRRAPVTIRSEEHTSELQSRGHLVCRLLLEKKNRGNDKQQTRTQVIN